MIDDDELYQLMLAVHRLESTVPTHFRVTQNTFRRLMLVGSWRKRMPLYLWITVKQT